MLSNRVNLSFLSELSDNKLATEFRKHGEIVSFTKDNSVFDSDETLNWFYVIVSGKVKVYEMNFQTNREQTLYLLIRGDMFDLVTLLDGIEHNLAVEVLEAGDAIKFPIDKVREWMRDFEDFERLIYRYVARQIRNIESLAIDLSLYDTKDRLIKLLLKNIETIEKRGVSLLEKLSHAEIANLIGTVRHIIDRHLKSLKEEGVVKSKDKKLNLLNAQKLLDKLSSY